MKLFCLLGFHNWGPLWINKCSTCGKKTYPMTDPLAKAQKAHAQALAAQKAMREASRERDKAVQAARAAGIPAAELAATLGVNRHRIHAMLKAAETK